MKNNTGVMYEAAGCGHLEVIKYLHDMGAQCSSDAIDIAAWNGHIEVLKWFYENRKEKPTENAMDMAAKKGYLEVIRFIYGNNWGQCSECAFIYSALENHFEVLKWLHNNIDVSNMENSPKGQAYIMHNAAHSGYLEIVKYLYESGYRFTKDILENAVSGNQLPVVMWLCENVPVVHSRIYAALKLAVKRNHLEIIKYLKEKLPK